jgi:hypothetical protein
MNIDLSKLVTAEQKQAKEKIQTLQAIAAKRYEVEVSGIFFGEYYVITDRESQAKLLSERTAAQENLRISGSGWKCLHLPSQRVGLYPFTNEEMVQIATLAYQHVAASFQREGELIQAVEEGTYTDDMLEQDWP